MKSESIKLENSPFVRAFTLSVIKTILSQKVSYEERRVINADLVPRTSDRVIQASFKKKKFLKNELAQPIPEPTRKISMQPAFAQQQIPQFPATSQQTTLTQDYGKINPLLQDPSISSIECPGPGKDLIIIRAGQKQSTKISLSPQEIKNLLKKIAESARVPLLEGVFRAAIDNFVINSVVSEVIGSRFIIKKQTPYAMLEPETR